MKITIISAAFPLRGGIAAFTSQLYKELSQSDEVNVVTFKRQYPNFLFPGKSQLDDKDSSDKIPTKVALDSINPFNWIREGIKIRDAKPDLVIYNFWFPFFGPCFGTINRIIKKNKHTLSMVICHNVIPHEKRPGDKPFRNYFFKGIDYYVTLSKSVDNDLLAIKPSAKHRLLFHPVYSNFGEPIDKNDAKSKLKIQDEKVILFFGFIRDYKGLDTLLEAMTLVKDKINLKLLVAGEFYEDENKYKNIVKENKIEDMVEFHSDFIPSQNVKYYFSASDAVILPYKSATQSGIVQIANNFHKPLIGTDTGGLGEIIKNDVNGYLVEPDNSKQLSEAILKFYKESREKVFSENIKLNQEKYSWAKFVDGIKLLIANN